MADEHDIIDAEEETALALPGNAEDGPSGTNALALSGANLPSVAEMAPALAEYKRRREAFLGWLADQFQEGVHYGVPPGCEPRTADSAQWRHKPSLYDAGARLFLDLFSLRPTYETDEGLWRMNGSKPGVYFRKCILLKADGQTAGEGTGVFRVGEKKMQENSATKMADKRARGAAVLDAVPYARELFTQDLEEIGSPLERLMAWIATQRAEHEAQLPTEQWLAKVCQACLYGKPVLTTNREAAHVEACLDAGCFDWATGERTDAAMPSATASRGAAPGHPQDAQEPRRGDNAPEGDPEAAGLAESPPSPTVGQIGVFFQQVAAHRDGLADRCGLTNEAWADKVCERLFGKEFLAITKDEFDDLCGNLKAGMYDWQAGEPVAKD